MKQTVIFLSLLFCVFLHAQSDDSLLRVVNGKSADTSKIKALTALSRFYYLDDGNTGLKYAKRAIDFSDSVYENGSYKAQALLQYGISLNVNGQFDSAEKYLQLSKSIYERLGDKRKQADCLNSLANTTGRQGKYEEALPFYFQALGIYSNLGLEQRESVVLGNIANTYAGMDDAPNAIKYYEKSISIKEKVGDDATLLSSYFNIAGIYLDLERIDEADNYANKAGKLSEKYGSKQDSVFLLNLRGKIASSRKDFPTALSFFNRAIKI